MEGKTGLMNMNFSISPFLSRSLFLLTLVSVSHSILIFPFLSPRNWSVSWVCKFLDGPPHSAVFQSTCSKRRVTFDKIAGCSRNDNGSLFPLVLHFRSVSELERGRRTWLLLQEGWVFQTMRSLNCLILHRISYFQHTATWISH